MIKKIVLVSFGPDVSEFALNYSINIAEKFGSKIYSLYVKPTTYYKEREHSLSDEEKRKNFEWNEFTYKENLNIFEEFHNKIIEAGIDSSYKVLEGVPCLEILKYAKNIAADLIVINKGQKFQDKFIVHQTTLHVIKNSQIPVLSTNQSIDTIKNILVPTDIYNIDSKAFEFANEFSKKLGSSITHLNIQNEHNDKIPVEEREKMHGDAYYKLAKIDFKNKNIKSLVLDSKDIAEGIIEYTNTNNIDLIILQTYSGDKDEVFHSNGSIAEKILPQVKCSVLTIKTNKEENNNDR